MKMKKQYIKPFAEAIDMQSMQMLAASIDIGVKDDGDGVDAGSSFSNTHDRFGGTAAPWENPDE